MDLKYLKSSHLPANTEQYSRIHHQKANLNGHVEGSEQCSWLIAVNGSGLFRLFNSQNVAASRQTVTVAITASILGNSC